MSEATALTTLLTVLLLAGTTALVLANLSLYRMIKLLRAILHEVSTLKALNERSDLTTGDIPWLQRDE